MSVVYQAEVVGEWVYLYSGRRIVRVSDPESTDPFSQVHAIRISAITGFKYDNSDYTCTLFANGHSYAITSTFGYCLNSQINASAHYIIPIAKALNLNMDSIFDMNRRSDLTAAARSRAEDLDNTIMSIKAELRDDLIEDTKKKGEKQTTESDGEAGSDDEGEADD